MELIKDNTIVLIGARGGSKRIPNKNLRRLGPISLLAYSIKSGISLGYKTYVSTDSKDIEEEGIAWGAAIIKRPPELATDYSTDTDWITHAIGEFTTLPSFIVLFRPTTPFRDTNILRHAISSFKEESSSLRSVEPVKEAIQKALLIKNDYLTPAYPLDVVNWAFGGEEVVGDITNLPNQMFPTSYMGNGYIDIVRSDHILKYKNLYGTKIQPFITQRVIEIDDETDLKIAEGLLK